jgi:hypothetical protein
MLVSSASTEFGQARWEKDGGFRSGDKKDPDDMSRIAAMPQQARISFDQKINSETSGLKVHVLSSEIIGAITKDGLTVNDHHSCPVGIV